MAGQQSHTRPSDQTPAHRGHSQGNGVTFGTWTSSVADFQVPYVLPQENGSRAGVVRAALTGPDSGAGTGAGTSSGSGAGLELRVERGLGLAVRPWSTAELDEKRHDGALRPDGRTWVTLSAALHGVGSAACGPVPLPQYVLSAREETFSFRLAPLSR